LLVAEACFPLVIFVEAFILLVDETILFRHWRGNFVSLRGLVNSPLLHSFVSVW
jgi:hypothetical protein